MSEDFEESKPLPVEETGDWKNFAIGKDKKHYGSLKAIFARTGLKETEFSRYMPRPVLERLPTRKITVKGRTFAAYAYEDVVARIPELKPPAPPPPPASPPSNVLEFKPLNKKD